MRISTLAIVGVVMGFFATGCGSVKAKDGADAGMTDADPGAVCEANSMSCDNGALYQCDAEGAQLSKVQDCQYGCTDDRCNECAANTTFCSGDDLVQCDASGTIANPQTCANGCTTDRCNTCEPGVKYCDGTSSVMCGDDGVPGASTNCGAAGCQGGVCNSCTPNTTTCQGDTLVVCNAGGTVASATNCALGCGTTGGAHCKALVPSYGVPAPSGTHPDLLVNAAASLDITNCAALDVKLTLAGVTTAVPATQLASVNQSGGPPICVVKYGTITINKSLKLTVVNGATSGGGVLSLQATGDIQIAGEIAFPNTGTGPAAGVTVVSYGATASRNKASGGGGGGAARAGGAGGSCIDCDGTTDYTGGSGGAAVTTAATRLTGGSKGGDVLLMSDTSVLKGFGGAGGGGLQLVSLTKVLVATTGIINLNAGGGTGVGFAKFSDLPAGGGGSGGTLVVEAPVVSFSTGGIAAANGGGGSGGCVTCMFVGTAPKCTHHNGEPGQLSTNRASGGDCTGFGDGGSEANGAASGFNGEQSDPGSANQAGGGGGGSSGFVFLRAKAAGNVTITAGAIVSPQPAVSAVGAN